MAISPSLNIGASALLTVQRQLEITSQNIANANVDGYTRQRVETAAAPPSPGAAGSRGDGMRGNGVTVTGLSRLRDELADITYRNEATNNGNASARSEVLERAQGVLGTFDNGAPTALTAFYKAFDQLNLTPDSTSARESVLAAGEQVTQQIHDANTQFTNLYRDTSLKIDSQVAQVNNLTKQVAGLNTQISNAIVSAQAPNDLMDARDVAIDQLAKLTGASYVNHPDGSTDVFLGSQPIVRGDKAYDLASYAAGGKPQVGFDYDVHGSPPNLKSAALGGSLGGYISVTNVTMPALQTQLDAVAKGLADSVNAVHAAGYGLDGSTGNPFFTGNNAATLAVDPNLTATKIAAASTAAGGVDGRNALALAQLRDNQTAMTNSDGTASTVGEGLRSLAGLLGTAAQAASQAMDSSTASLDGANSARSSSNGVNTDEEMVDLVKYQHSYEAAARVITVSNSMLDTLMQLVR